MAQQLTFAGVPDGAVVAKLVEFSDVVQNSRGQKQIEIKFGIMRRNLVRQAAKSDDVFEQTAKVGVVHHLRGGRPFVTS